MIRGPAAWQKMVQAGVCTQTMDASRARDVCELGSCRILRCARAKAVRNHIANPQLMTCDSIASTYPDACQAFLTSSRSCVISLVAIVPFQLQVHVHNIVGMYSTYMTLDNKKRAPTVLQQRQGQFLRRQMWSAVADTLHGRTRSCNDNSMHDGVISSLLQLISDGLQIDPFASRRGKGEEEGLVTRLYKALPTSLLVQAVS